MWVVLHNTLQVELSDIQCPQQDTCCNLQEQLTDYPCPQEYIGHRFQIWLTVNQCLLVEAYSNLQVWLTVSQCLGVEAYSNPEVQLTDHPCLGESIGHMPQVWLTISQSLRVETYCSLRVWLTDNLSVWLTNSQCLSDQMGACHSVKVLPLKLHIPLNLVFKDVISLHPLTRVFSPRRLLKDIRRLPRTVVKPTGGTHLNRHKLLVKLTTSPNR